MATDTMKSLAAMAILGILVGCASSDPRPSYIPPDSSAIVWSEAWCGVTAGSPAHALCVIETSPGARVVVKGELLKP